VISTAAVSQVTTDKYDSDRQHVNWTTQTAKHHCYLGYKRWSALASGAQTGSTWTGPHRRL